MHASMFTSLQQRSRATSSAAGLEQAETVARQLHVQHLTNVHRYFQDHVGEVTPSKETRDIKVSRPTPRDAELASTVSFQRGLRRKEVALEDERIEGRDMDEDAQMKRAKTMESKQPKDVTALVLKQLGVASQKTAVRQQQLAQNT